MPKKELVTEADLAALAKELRMKSGKTKADIARELGASRPAVQQAENNPEQSLTKLRVRIIEACSPYTIEGPLFRIRRK